MLKRNLIVFALAMFLSTAVFAESAVDLKPYGFVGVSASWDQHHSYTGNNILYVYPINNDTKVSEFNLTANDTRLGLDLKSNADSDIKASGKVEFDFYGGGAQNKSAFMMRHAYLKLDGSCCSMIFGQTWDVISPLLMTTVNNASGWGTGNIGYRRPQVRVSKIFNDKVTVDAALARGIGEDLTTGTPASADGYDDNITVNVPQGQARVGLILPMGKEKAKIGVSGHYGRAKAYNNAATEYRKYKTSSINADVCLPVRKDILVKGEVFSGENLKSFYGSVLNTDTFNGVDSSGGWVDVTFKLPKSFQVSFGTGLDEVDDDNYANGYRLKNQFAFANAQYVVSSGFGVGVEISKWKTEYKNADDADSIRLQTMFKYTF